MVTSLSSSIENWSRERRTKEEEELSEEELGLSSFFFSLSTISKWALWAVTRSTWPSYRIMNKEDEQNERRPQLLSFCSLHKRQTLPFSSFPFFVVATFQVQIYSQCDASEASYIWILLDFLFFFKAKNTAVALICMPIDLTFPLRKSELLKGTENWKKGEGRPKLQ